MASETDGKTDAAGDAMDRVFKALADPSRRQLLDHLHADNGQTLGQLCAPLTSTRQAVTKHLAVLEAANLVTVVWRGGGELRYPNPPALYQIYHPWVGA